jgi:hypothetical protein
MSVGPANPLAFADSSEAPQEEHVSRMIRILAVGYLVARFEVACRSADGRDLSALPDRAALRAFLYQEFFAKR